MGTMTSFLDMITQTATQHFYDALIEFHLVNVRPRHLPAVRKLLRKKWGLNEKPVWALDEPTKYSVDDGNPNLMDKDGPEDTKTSLVDLYVKKLEESMERTKIEAYDESKPIDAKKKEADYWNDDEKIDHETQTTKTTMAEIRLHSMLSNSSTSVCEKMIGKRIQPENDENNQGHQVMQKAYLLLNTATYDNITTWNAGQKFGEYTWSQEDKDAWKLVTKEAFQDHKNYNMRILKLKVVETEEFKKYIELNVPETNIESSLEKLNAANPDLELKYGSLEINGKTFWLGQAGERMLYLWNAWGTNSPRTITETCNHYELNKNKLRIWFFTKFEMGKFSAERGFRNKLDKFLKELPKRKTENNVEGQPPSKVAKIDVANAIVTCLTEADMFDQIQILMEPIIENVQETIADRLIKNGTSEETIQNLAATCPIRITVLTQDVQDSIKQVLVESLVSQAIDGKLTCGQAQERANLLGKEKFNEFNEKFFAKYYEIKNMSSFEVYVATFTATNFNGKFAYTTGQDYTRQQEVDQWYTFRRSWNKLMAIQREERPHEWSKFNGPSSTPLQKKDYPTAYAKAVDKIIKMESRYREPNYQKEYTMLTAEQQQTLRDEKVNKVDWDAFINAKN